jgi:hypothetical protein
MTSPETLFDNPNAVHAGELVVAGYLEVAFASFAGEARKLEGHGTQQIIRLHFPEFRDKSRAELSGLKSKRALEYKRTFDVANELLEAQAAQYSTARTKAAEHLSALILQNLDKPFEFRRWSDGDETAEDTNGETEEDRRALRPVSHGIIRENTLSGILDGRLAATVVSMATSGEIIAQRPSNLTIVLPDLQPRYELAIAP